jgi:coenzyme F420-0:L-glutamate ligase / coenzyme F420-1:gamma-L-glutamate ligase
VRPSRIEIVALAGLPEVVEGERIGALVAQAAERAGQRLGTGDVVIVSQKIVSKAEGRIRELAAVEPGDEAVDLARELGKDARLVQLVLDESRTVLRAERGVLIVETRGGWICANAGIDASNVPGAQRVSLLPEDADASARRIRSEIREAVAVAPAVVIADSFGRAWRRGQADVAIGCAGLVPLDDWRGRSDRQGRQLTATLVAVADEAAAAADLVRGKDAGAPVAVARGLDRYVTPDDGPGAAALRRPEAEDLFR